MRTRACWLTRLNKRLQQHTDFDNGLRALDRATAPWRRSFVDTLRVHVRVLEVIPAGSGSGLEERARPPVWDACHAKGATATCPVRHVAYCGRVCAVYL